MKLTYPICCGVVVHKTFLVATIITSEYVVPHYRQKRFSTFYNSIVDFKNWLKCSRKGRRRTSSRSSRTRAFPL